MATHQSNGHSSIKWLTRWCVWLSVGVAAGEGDGEEDPWGLCESKVIGQGHHPWQVGSTFLLPSLKIFSFLSLYLPCTLASMQFTHQDESFFFLNIFPGLMNGVECARTQATRCRGDGEGIEWIFQPLCHHAAPVSAREASVCSGWPSIALPIAFPKWTCCV